MAPVFEFKNVSYRYKKDHAAALHELSFTIPEGQKIAIVGPNGAGKSTMIFHMNGLFLCESGEVLFRGERIGKHNQAEMVRHAGVVFQDPDDQIISMTVKDDIAFGPLQLGLSASEARNRADESMELLRITHLSGSNPGELSFGQRKLVAIAGVLAMNTGVVIFDEPMAFLDPSGQQSMQEIMDQLAAAGKTVIAATHQMQFVAEWADYALVMKDGQCLGGMTPRQLFCGQPELLAAAHLNLPPVTKLFMGLCDDPLTMPITLQEAKDWLSDRLHPLKAAPVNEYL